MGGCISGEGTVGVARTGDTKVATNLYAKCKKPLSASEITERLRSFTGAATLAESSIAVVWAMVNLKGHFPDTPKRPNQVVFTAPDVFEVRRPRSWWQLPPNRP